TAPAAAAARTTMITNAATGAARRRPEGGLLSAGAGSGAAAGGGVDAKGLCSKGLWLSKSLLSSVIVLLGLQWNSGLPVQESTRTSTEPENWGCVKGPTPRRGYLI